MIIRPKLGKRGPKLKLNSRAKGAAGELELAHYLQDKGLSARRGQQFHGGADSPDVVCDDLTDVHLECKRVERIDLYAWMEQANTDAGEHKMPVVVFRKNKKKWLMIVELDVGLELLKMRETFLLCQ